MLNALVIKHVLVAELPASWRAQLAKSEVGMVTVRIEEVTQAGAPAEAFTTDDPAFGIWRDREDMADIATYVRKIRQPQRSGDSSSLPKTN